MGTMTLREPTPPVIDKPPVCKDKNVRTCRRNQCHKTNYPQRCPAKCEICGCMDQMDGCYDYERKGWCKEQPGSHKRTVMETKCQTSCGWCDEEPSWTPEDQSTSKDRFLL